MNVLILGAYDTGGQGIRIKQAFDRHSDWAVRSMVKDRQYMVYESDLPFRRTVMESEYQNCDVVHVRNRFDLYDELAAKFGPKPVVYHAHGTLFRGDPSRFVREARERNAVIVVSTLDLWLLAPDDAEWLAAPYNVDELEAM